MEFESYKQFWNDKALTPESIIIQCVTINSNH